jgi:hypothetical protein
MDVRDFLRKLDLAQYEPALRDNLIDSRVLPKLTAVGQEVFIFNTIWLPMARLRPNHVFATNGPPFMRTTMFRRNQRTFNSPCG